MVSGVGALDIALFIVAADDGWMPQSEEHLHILNYLGVKNVIIALTKADLAEDLDFTVELVREELLGTTLEEAPIVPVSSITGMGSMRSRRRSSSSPSASITTPARSFHVSPWTVPSPPPAWAL